jgi:hypothetical protein
MGRQVKWACRHEHYSARSRYVKFSARVVTELLIRPLPLRLAAIQHSGAIFGQNISLRYEGI